MTVGVGSFARCCISTTVAAGSFARCSGLRFDACRSNVSTGSSSASLSVVPRRIFYTKSTGSYSGFHTLNFNGFCTTRPFSTVSFARLAFLAGFSLPFPAGSSFRLDCPSSGCDFSSGAHPGVCFSRRCCLLVAFLGVVSLRPLFFGLMVRTGGNNNVSH